MNDLAVDRSPCWPVSAFHFCSSVPPAQRLPGNAIHIQIHSQLFFLAAVPRSPWLWTPSQTRPEVCFTDTGVPPSSQVHNHHSHLTLTEPAVSRDWVLAAVRNTTAFSDIGQPPMPARVCPKFSYMTFSFLLVLLAFQSNPNHGMGGRLLHSGLGGGWGNFLQLLFGCGEKAR